MNETKSAAQAVMAEGGSGIESPAGESNESVEGLSTDLLERRRKFGQWFRECRRQIRITQSELARALNYDSSQLISNIERGVSLLPSRRLPEFARALGCSVLSLEVQYFQCSARTQAESRMPNLLLKYLPLIEALEYTPNASDSEILALLHKIRARGDKADSTPLAPLDA